MSSIVSDNVIFTIPDPRSVGYLVDKLVIREIDVEDLVLPALSLNNALTQVLVRDPVDNSIYYNNTLAAAAITAIGPVGASPNANGMTLAANTINLEPASAAFPGVLTTGAQTIAGAKTFTGAAIFSSTVDMDVLDLPATTTTVGFIRIGTNIFAHSAASNTFVGPNAGNQTTTGTLNTVVGATSAPVISTGSRNTMVGASIAAAVTTISDNTCVGAQAAASLSTGAQNTIVGSQSAQSLSVGANNTCVGYRAGFVMSNGAQNVIIGSLAGDAVTSATSNVIIGHNAAGSHSTGNLNVIMGQNTAPLMNGATNNVIIGQGSASALTNGSSNTIVGQASGTALAGGGTNTIVGRAAGTALSTGSTNLILGNGAGTAVTTTSGNILIANTGVVGDTNTTRIGSAQTVAYMAGILPYVPTTTSNLMTIDTDTRLGNIPLVMNQAYTTSNITLLTGGVPSGDVINVMTLRGAPLASPFPYPITYCRIGPVVMCTLPAFQVTSNTGGDQTEVRIATGIPVELRPTTFSANCAISVQDSSNQEDTVYKVLITTAGTMVLLAPNAQNFTVNWGLQEDITITYVVL